MTEQEKMQAGKIYDSSDETLLAIRTKAHKLCQTYNQTADTEEEAREQMMRDLIPECAKGVYLQGPIYLIMVHLRRSAKIHLRTLILRC